MKQYFLVITLIFTMVFVSCKSKKQATSGASVTTVPSGNNGNGSTTTGDVAEGLNLGNKAPGFTMVNMKDESVSLSSFRGKLVLIDFWASWCGPCRKENPSVVEAYKKFHSSKFKSGDSFEILSVSLDNNKASWLNAIAKDSLNWPGHVSDLQGWNNAVAQLYYVNSIPTNVLVDGNGIIIAKSLHGKELEKAITAQIK